MYHYFKTSAICRLFFLSAALYFGFILSTPAQAEPSRLTTAQTCHKQDLAFVSKTFDNIPPRRQLKKEPTSVEIYEFDESPRGNRSPFLMVHGLRGEHYPYFRWQKVANHLSSDKKFNANFKIYLARYPTSKRMEESVPMFRKAVERLYSACNKRQVTVMALSIGGNLVYELFVGPYVDLNRAKSTSRALGETYGFSPSIVLVESPRSADPGTQTESAGSDPEW